MDQSPQPARFPLTLAPAALRGLRGACPRCGEARLFARWLRPTGRCSQCGQDWTLHVADDFPPYISIFVTGHLMAPLLIWLVLEQHLSAWAAAAIIVPFAVVVMLGVLQPAKGAVIALQWWLGMGAFVRERAQDDPAP
ncbi:MAG: DUF983 domain-containing protein [Sphingomonadaceae bacterium]